MARGKAIGGAARIVLLCFLLTGVAFRRGNQRESYAAPENGEEVRARSRG